MKYFYSAALLLLIGLFFLSLAPAGKAPEGMLLIPGGEFVMGTDENVSPIQADAAVPVSPHLNDAGPARSVYLDPFYIDLRKVTRQEYRRFARSKGGVFPFDQIAPEGPVTEVTWQEASDYCRSIGKRLPTEEEWEKAARGSDGRLYPWGNHFNSEVGKAVVARSLPEGRSPYGAREMVGSGWEWTADWYRPYPNNPHRADDFWKGYRVIRGGSWNDQPEEVIHLFARTTTRFYYYPDRPSTYIGFRCAQSA